MYYEYWGLKKPPFDNVPDPSMYVDCHTSMESAIAETLFAIEEGDECVAVIVGDVGLGKTLSLRMVIDSLDLEKYKIALITNPSITFVQILQEIIGQLTGKQCVEKRKINLLEMFNRLLFSTMDEGKKILILIDEANAIPPANLESLRLLTNMQDDRKNLFTMVLAGQIELARRLEHPKRANLFQRIGTYSRIDKLESVEVVKTYVETRLNHAGAMQKIFADDAYDKFWEHSNHGVPRLINKLAKLCLKAGETNEFKSIDGSIVDQIGSRFNKLTGPAIQKRRSRKRSVKKDETSIPVAEQMDTAKEEAVVPNPQPLEPDEQQSETSLYIPEQRERDTLRDNTSPSPEYIGHALAGAEEPVAAEVNIGEYTIQINLPDHLIRQALTSSQEHRFKLAGVLAAETLKKYPQLTASYSTDPVSIWGEIRDFVLSRFSREGERKLM